MASIIIKPTDSQQGNSGEISNGDNNQNNNAVQGGNEGNVGQNQGNLDNNQGQSIKTEGNNQNQTKPTDSQQNGLGGQNQNNQTEGNNQNDENNQQPDNGGGINYVDYYNGEYYIKEGVKYWTTYRGDEIKVVLEPDGTETLIEMKLGEQTKDYLRKKTLMKKIMEKVVAETPERTMAWAYLKRVQTAVETDNPLMFAFDFNDKTLENSD